jgi:hypothetical protein
VSRFETIDGVKRQAWWVKPYLDVADGNKAKTSRWYRQRQFVAQTNEVSREACRQFQLLLISAGYAVGRSGADGLFGADTDKAVREFQQARKLTVDGVLGPNSAVELVLPLVRRLEKEHGIPGRILSGKVRFESGADTGAIGENGFDLGIAQINLDPGVHGATITFEMAMDVEWALDYSARRWRVAFDRYKGWGANDKLAADAAILQHNWPVGADSWVRNGTPPKSSTMDPRVPASRRQQYPTWAEFYVGMVRESTF